MKVRLLSLLILCYCYATSLHAQNIFTQYESPFSAEEKIKVDLTFAAEWSFSKHKIYLKAGTDEFKVTPFDRSDIISLTPKLNDSTHSVLVTYADGTVTLVTPKISDDGLGNRDAYFLFRYLNTESVGGQPKKIIGDDLYILTDQGVYVSRDNGKQWTLDNDGLPAGNNYPDIAIDTNQNVWLLTNSGLYKQALASNTWTVIPNTEDLSAQKIFIDGKQHIWLFSYNGIYVSTDGGTSFKAGPSGLPQSTAAWEFGDDPQGNLYVLTSFGFTGNGANALYYSSGGTEGFTKIDADLFTQLSELSQLPFLSIAGDQSLHLGTVAGGFTSTDKGATWKYDPKVRASSANSLVQTADNSVMFATDLGVFKSSTNGTWSQAFPTSGFVNGPAVFTGNNGTLYVRGKKYKDNLANSPIYEVWKSSNNGSSWTLDTVGSGNIGMKLFSVDNHGVQYAVGDEYKSGVGNLTRVWRKEPGQSWTLDINGLPEMDFKYNVTQLFEDASGNVYLCVLTVSSQVTTLYKRTNGAWSSESDFNFFPTGMASDAQDVFVSTTKGIYRKQNGTYTALPLPNDVALTQLVSTSAAMDQSGKLWAYFEVLDFDWGGGLGKGVYYTTDFTTWSKPADNLDTMLIKQLVSIDTSLYVITQTNGVFVTSTNTPSSNSVQAIVRSNDIHVFPNPATNKIEFALDNLPLGKTTLQVIDLLGKERFTVTNDLTTNKHLALSTSKLDDGMYFYFITDSKGQMHTGKINIAK